MNKAAFYTHLRKRGGPFGTSMSQRQVDGIEAILDEGAGLPLSHLANVLAQVHRETGAGMYPVKETVYSWSSDKNPSDATVIARLNRAFAKGQLTWVSKPYWRSGYFGRGQIQITHEDNYQKMSETVGVDLVKNPSAALDLSTSARIAVRGMRDGSFTERSLEEYNGTKYDHAGARAIVNGDKNKRDKGSLETIGQTITKNGIKFEEALVAAGYKLKVSKPTPTPPTPQSIWAALIAAYKAMFKGTRT